MTQTITTQSPTLAALGKDERLIAQPPTNFESPLELLDSFITPVDRFFIRSNGPISVDIDRATWRLNLTGLIDRELELSLSDLQSMHATTITAFLECSGNSRSSFPPDQPVEGTNWGPGAIGNATWTGVSLADVLTLAGVREDAVDIVAQGGDFASMQRGLPIETAQNGHVLLAWQMNGQDLPAAHGGPVRLVVPGWGAIASTKWIVGLDVIDHRFDGFWNADNYVLWNADGTPQARVTTMPVKSMITSPASNATIASGRVSIAGFAWSGNGEIARVEVSTNDGSTWSDATIIERAGPFAWVRFEYSWDALPGSTTLRSRATDSRGNTQPAEAIWNAKGYQMNAITSVSVTVI